MGEIEKRREVRRRNRNSVLAKQRLLDMYEEMLKEALSERWVVHCTDSKRVVNAANKAVQKDYEEHMKAFNDILEEGSL